VNKKICLILIKNKEFIKMANEFLVSVANAVLLNPNTNEAIAVGKTNITSSITLSMQKTEVRGGINNPLLYTYFHDRLAEFNIEEATFSRTVLALNAGTSILNKTIQIVETERVSLTSNVGTLSKTAIGDVTVFLDNGTSQMVTPVSGSVITVSGGGNQSVTAVYTYNGNADEVMVEATTPPANVRLILTAEVRDSNNIVVSYLQIDVPSYQIAGNYTLNLSANGVSTQSLSGVALVSKDAQTGKDYYFKASWIPATTTSIPVSAIAGIPSVLTFSRALRPQSQQINVLGIRGGVYANANITNLSTFVKTSGCTTITVNGSGVVTSSSNVNQGDTALITITYYTPATGSLTDTVNVIVGA
jgi:hypothetical protein